jgi:hypothetical protein
MATKRDVEFYAGEDWQIAFEFNDGSGADLNITSGTIAFVLLSGTGTTVMTRTVGDGITITNGATGAAALRVTPTMQTTAAVASGVRYQWKITATLSTGVISRQAGGALLVLP